LHITTSSGGGALSKLAAADMSNKASFKSHIQRDEEEGVFTATNTDDDSWTKKV